MYFNFNFCVSPFFFSSAAHLSFVYHTDNQFQNILRIWWHGQKIPLSPKINVENAFDCTKLTLNPIICRCESDSSTNSPCQHWLWGEGGVYRESGHFSHNFWNWLSEIWWKLKKLRFCMLKEGYLIRPQHNEYQWFE